MVAFQMKKLNTIIIIFGHFLLLGCISFGGPGAHIGYFQKRFVEKLTWLSNEEYANLVSLSQILPGPGSSQVGFAIGLHKAGILGGIAAFLGFTLPSFLLMFWLAIAVDINNPQPWLVGVIHGLKLLAVVVVLDAINNMFKSFCTTKITISIALVSALTLILVSSALLQIFVIVAAGSVGMLISRDNPNTSVQSTTYRFHIWPLALVIGLFVLSFMVQNVSEETGFVALFFQSGSLVFGGGHVVLPLLQANIGEALTNEQFLFGYAAAQGVPGPMFTIATFVGALLMPAAPLLGAIAATLAVFLPGFLLVLSLKGIWQRLLNNMYFSGAARGINAAVVGLLIATLYDPILISTLNSVYDLIIIAIGLVCAKIFKLHILLLIGLFSALGLAVSL